jgi:hypothetical protein
MASKFFQKPQLGQAQMSNAQKSSTPSTDQTAQNNAEQAAKGIDMLHNLAQGITDAAYKGYTENVQAKNRLESANERPAFIRHVQKQIEETEDYENLGSEGLKAKYKESVDSFMKGHEDKSYTHQLRKDLVSYSPKMLENMFQQRDAKYSAKVTDLTAQSASDASQEFQSSMTSSKDYIGVLQNRIQESMLAHQSPASAKMITDDDTRGVYQGLTLKQAQAAAMKGVMIQLGNPKNSRLASIVHTKEFMDTMGVNAEDPEYQKLVSFALRKGQKADAFNYSKSLDGLRESMYIQTNMGVTVDVDKAIIAHRQSGKPMTAKDEHKLRKDFKDENGLVIETDTYMKSLIKGVDHSVGKPPKVQQKMYNKAFLQSLKITDGSEVSLTSIANQLRDPDIAFDFGKYMTSGGHLPKTFTAMLDVPAGYGDKASAKKWSEANTVITAMERATALSGKSMEQELGVALVSRIRGMSRLIEDDLMDEATKKNAIEQFSLSATSFDSSGFTKGTEATKLDPDWLQDVASDAAYTGEDYVGQVYNAKEIEHNYQNYRLQNYSDEQSKEMAKDLFESSNRAFELPNNDEITVPTKHVFLNNESIIGFSKDVKTFPSIKKARDAAEASWHSFSNIDSTISINKSHSFAKTGNYQMLVGGVVQGTFNYDQMSKWIGEQDYKTRAKITGVKNGGSFKEVKDAAIKNRNKKVEPKISSDDVMKNLSMLTF